MILSTTIGRIVIPISVRIPQRVLSACYRTIPRPPWEIRPYCIGLCTILLSIILVFMLAVFNARKIFDNVNRKSRKIKTKFPISHYLVSCSCWMAWKYPRFE